ncbi:glycosyltransferase [Sphingomonas sanguinis]|uniref:glycosyltransferase n=1 Tax=Sphingomonas sp. LC-1 TaxID=3110957 RepID=UPI0021BB036F|nr:glycosyltransferase [Sphingomonas sp. LC-1]MCT8002098.1 glycosyltransferase [Sphingomonas sp. LC-1]
MSGPQNHNGRRVAIFVERFLPPSQAFVLAQARGYERYSPEFLVGKRMGEGHGGESDLPVHVIANSPLMKAGSLLLKIPRVAVPGLFPPLARADLIHAHFGKNGYVLSPLARALGKPLVTTFHGFDATYRGDPKKPGGFNQVRFFAKGRAQMARAGGYHIAVSDFIRDRLLDLGYPSTSIHRHYIGVDRGLFRPDPRPRIPGRVVSIARFVEYKGYRYMIDALARVAAQGIPVDYVMIGDGPEAAATLAHARASLPRVTHHPRLSQEAIRDELGQAQLYLHGSVTLDNGHAEAFGIANLEAQAVGTPVVAFRSGGVGEAVEQGRTGLLAEERDVAAMADAVASLLSDGERWRSFHERAPEWVAERFDLMAQTRQLEDYYDRVLDDYRRK